MSINNVHYLHEKTSKNQIFETGRKEAKNKKTGYAKRSEIKKRPILLHNWNDK